MKNIEKYRDKLLDSVNVCNWYDYFNSNDDCVQDCKFCEERFVKWLFEDSEKQVLSDAERKYLSEVIRPFRNEVAYIKKDCTDAYFIVIAMKHDCAIYLPTFPVDSSMYKGMEPFRKYKIEELCI